MTLPVGISTCTVTLGPAYSFAGEEGVISGTIVADRNVVWAASGAPLFKTETPIAASSSGGQASMVVPHVDQAGFVDAAGDTVTGWYYTFTGRATFDGGRTEAISKRFQVFVGQSTIDLDLVPDGPVIPGVTTPSATVTSVAGKTGAVQLAAADIYDLSNSIAPTVRNLRRDYGATGVTTEDASQAFKDAYQEAANNTSAPGGISSNRRGQRVIEIPAGTFVITEPAALMRDLGISRTGGLTFRGAGRDATTIVFSPTTADAYLAENNDDWLNLAFEDMTFRSTVVTASFMKSVSDGGAQNYAFNRVDWQGDWKYGIDLLGSNTNSEHSWFHCGMHGNWTTFLRSGDTNTSDQFLNYNFFACNWEVTTGDFIDMAKGGSINIWGGSFIDGSTNPNPSTFFKLRGGDHAYGVQRLLVIGARFEHRNTFSRLVDCEWKGGSVAFLSCDMASQTPAGYSANAIYAYFGANGDAMPAVTFRDCQLAGRHQYRYGSGSWAYAKRVLYDACTITNWPEAAAFINYVADGSTGNAGGVPPIGFRNCRGNSGSAGTLHPFDCTLGTGTAMGAEPRRHTVVLKNANGSLPQTGGTAEIYLPLGARIESIRFVKDVESSSIATNYTYQLATSETTPTVLALLNGALGGGAQWKDGFDVTFPDIAFICDTESKRHLVLTATNIAQYAFTSGCHVTYVV